MWPQQSWLLQMFRLIFDIVHRFFGMDSHDALVFLRMSCASSGRPPPEERLLHQDSRVHEDNLILQSLGLRLCHRLIPKLQAPHWQQRCHTRHHSKTHIHCLQCPLQNLKNNRGIPSVMCLYNCKLFERSVAEDTVETVTQEDIWVPQEHAPLWLCFETSGSGEDTKVQITSRKNQSRKHKPASTLASSHSCGAPPL